MENYSKWIGIDESGKGDFFGNLVVSGVIFDESKKELFKDLNIRDSKKISDLRIKYLSSIIKKNLKYETLSISPKRFNEIYKIFKNINMLLAWAYSKVILNLIDKEDVKLIIVDKFTTKNYIDLYLKEKSNLFEKIELIHGERDIAVASASIIARDSFLKSIDKLKEKWNFDFPKGANEITVEKGVEFVKKYGLPSLHEVAKINFRNYKKILEKISQKEIFEDGEFYVL